MTKDIEREAFESTRAGEFKNVIFVMNEYWPEGHYVGKSNHNEDTDDAHYLSHSWFSWLDRAKLEAKKLEGCVVVPIKCPDPDFADLLFDELGKKAIGTFGEDMLIHFSDINEEKIWDLMLEAARGGNENT